MRWLAVVTAGVLLTLCGALTYPTSADGGVRSAHRTSPAPVLGTGTVLFVDLHRVARLRNVRRTYLTGTKVQVDGRPLGQVAVDPVLKYQGSNPAADAADGDKDVDSSSLLGVSSVMEDQVNHQPLYRMWLRSGSSTGYRESTDGLHWHIHDPDSVIVVPNVIGAKVVKDPRTGSYYLLGWNKKQEHYVEFISSDGIHFTPTSDFAGLLARLSGDVINATADPVTKTIYAIAKQKGTWGRLCRRSPRTLSGGRTFGVNASSTPSRDDHPSSARSWRNLPLAVSADCIDELSVPSVSGTTRPAQLYGMPFMRYGDQFIGLPWMFQITRTTGNERAGITDGPVDTQIASTPDVASVPWRRAEASVRVHGRRARPSLIQRGSAGAWDDGMIFGQAGLVTIGNRMVLYYSGWDGTHLQAPGRRTRVGAVTWRPDGFVGLKVVTSARMGSVVTREFRIPRLGYARDLHVNVALKSGRRLRVAVLYGSTDKAIPGFEASRSTVVMGDRGDAVIRWRGVRLGHLRTRNLRLAFSYGSGTLFSFRVH